MIDRKVYSNGIIKIRVSKLYENEKWKEYDADVISGIDTSVGQFVELYLSEINEHSNGTIFYIDGTEDTMEEAMNGRVLCHFMNDLPGHLMAPDVWVKPVRFATIKMPKIPGSNFENLTLFVPRSENERIS